MRSLLWVESLLHGIIALFDQSSLVIDLELYTIYRGRYATHTYIRGVAKGSSNDLVKENLWKSYLLGAEHVRLLEQCECYFFFPELFSWNSD